MPFTTLIDTDAVARHLEDPAFAVIDCRFDLGDESSGERAYLVRHIPGAAYAHLDRDLSGFKTGTNGRHPLPDPDRLAQTFSRFGIDRPTQVAAYGDGTDMFAARLWWLLRWLGHDNVAVLDGGFNTWVAEGRPTRSGLESRAPRHFTGAPRPEMVVTVDEVADLAQQNDWSVVDARAPERYRGDVEPVDRAAGHIPGAKNHFYKTNLDERGMFLPPADLREVFGEAEAPDHVVCYCGSGVSACHNLLALEHAGLRGAKLYPGSWSEWSSDPARPIEKG